MVDYVGSKAYSALSPALYVSIVPAGVLPVHLLRYYIDYNAPRNQTYFLLVHYLLLVKKIETLRHQVLATPSHHDNQQARCYFDTAHCLIEPSGPEFWQTHRILEPLGFVVGLSECNAERVCCHDRTVELIWYCAKPVRLTAGHFFGETEPL